MMRLKNPAFRPISKRILLAAPELGRSCRAVAAMEFGMLAPIMALMVIGVFDLSKAGILWEQTWNASRSIADSASTLAIQTDGSTSLTQVQAQQALSSVFAEMPWLRAGIATGNGTAGQIPANTISAVLTSVSFAPTNAPCGPGTTPFTPCTYAAVVKWSKAYSGNNFITGSSVLRPCVTLTQVAPGSPASLTTVPTLAVKTALESTTTGTNVPDPFLIADVTFTYQPFFHNFLPGNGVTFWVTSYQTVRTTAANSATPWTTYSATTTQDPASEQCP
jgi:Flp pilus assembly protein TadG